MHSSFNQSSLFGFCKENRQQIPTKLDFYGLIVFGPSLSAFLTYSSDPALLFKATHGGMEQPKNVHEFIPEV